VSRFEEGVGRLHPEDIKAIAAAVAVLLATRRERPVEGRLADAEEIARAYGVTAGYVRANAARLGAVRIGDGPRPRLRFDPEIVAERWTARGSGKRSGPRESEAPATRSRQGKRPPAGTSLDLVPVTLFNGNGITQKTAPRRANARGHDAEGVSPRRGRKATANPAARPFASPGSKEPK